jgi:hypothetical protein
MSERLGWLFCEFAFRGWDWLGNDAYRDYPDFTPKLWAWLPHKFFSASHAIGTWFYRRSIA